ncbi:MBL fold metallo-hydrolase [Aliiruegeria lutimaris]|nr:MBL fold metallo-hydrolase [Aliiruegeria lutimaris]
MVDLTLVEWIHGSEDCEAARESADYIEWQQVQYLPDTYVFRQNKCSDYEANFVYLLVGATKALLIDTGATKEGGEILYEMVRKITPAPLIVVHTHGHPDHWRGDPAFKNAENTEVVRIGAINMLKYLGLDTWPDDPVGIKLGDRLIEVLPTPGHESASLAYYDPRSQFLFTGDTVLPGRLYVNDWPSYVDSIARLLDWVKDKPVAHVVGGHIEMQRTPNVQYPRSTQYQPDEAPLPLSVSDIEMLYAAISGKETPERIELGSFVVWPY